jgi:hypothetical protein
MALQVRCHGRVRPRNEGPPPCARGAPGLAPRASAPAPPPKHRPERASPAGKVATKRGATTVSPASRQGRHVRRLRAEAPHRREAIVVRHPAPRAQRRHLVDGGAQLLEQPRPPRTGAPLAGRGRQGRHGAIDRVVVPTTLGPVRRSAAHHLAPPCNRGVRPPLRAGPPRRRDARERRDVAGERATPPDRRPSGQGPVDLTRGDARPSHNATDRARALRADAQSARP